MNDVACKPPILRWVTAPVRCPPLVFLLFVLILFHLSIIGLRGEEDSASFCRAVLPGGSLFTGLWHRTRTGRSPIFVCWLLLGMQVFASGTGQTQGLVSAGSAVLSAERPLLIFH